MTTRAARILSRAQAWPVRAALLALLLTATLSQLTDACGAKAQAEMMSVGQEMLRLSEQAGAPDDRVLLNGAELRVSRGRTPRTVDQLLGQAEENCAGEAMRGGDTGHGFVSCGAADAGSLALPISYVYAERRGPTTHFIGIDSPQPVELGALFPREGDAPGQDPTALPRPPSSRRAFSMFVAGQPYQAAVYLDDERRFDDLVAHYRSALPRAGWKVIARWKTDEGLGPRQASVVIERAGVLALLLVSQDRAETTTTFLTMEANREQ
jgi:hypothetical protein